MVRRSVSRRFYGTEGFHACSHQQDQPLACCAHQRAVRQKLTTPHAPGLLVGCADRVAWRPAPARCVALSGSCRAEPARSRALLAAMHACTQAPTRVQAVNAAG